MYYARSIYGRKDKLFYEKDLIPVMAIVRHKGTLDRLALQAKWNGATHPNDMYGLDWVHPDCPPKNMDGDCIGIYWVSAGDYILSGGASNNEEALSMLKEDSTWLPHS